MTLVVKILTGSPEKWVQVECYAVEVWKRCPQDGTLFKAEYLNQKYCSDACRWNAANDKRAQE